MRRRAAMVAIIFILASALPLAGGCGNAGAAMGTIKLLDIDEPASFAIYYPLSVDVQPSLPDQPIDARLSGITGLAAASLSPAATAILARNGFVLTPGQPGDALENYRRAGTPVFITLDSLAHSFDLLSASVLAGLEEGSLYRDLQGLTGAMLEVSGSLGRAAEGQVKPAARDNQAFFGVAARLLDPAAAVPSEVEETVAQEVRLLEAGKGVDESPIFGYRQDYGIYLPAGQSARSEESSRYFRAAMWFGSMVMRLRPAENPPMREAGRQETRQAILAVGGLHVARVGEESALAVWERLYQVTRFFTQVSDDPDIYDYTRLMVETYGREFPLSRLESDGDLDAFIDKALALPRATGTAAPVGDAAGGATAGLYFLGRRTSLDDQIYAQLVEPEVAGRTMPRGLDVPAALGSERAERINLELYEDSRFPAYQAQLESLQRDFSTLNMRTAAGNTYWSRLYAIRMMLYTPGQGFPAFMRGPAWTDRCLYSFLGSSVELRSGDIAGAEQDTTGATAPSGSTTAVIPGYVEPNPEALACLAVNLDLMRRGLRERGMLETETGKRLDALYTLLVELKGIAETELRNQAFSEQEAAVLSGCGQRLAYIDGLSGTGNAEAGLTSPQAVDAYTGPETLEMLTQATGYPVIYHVIVPYQGGLYYTEGAGFSYYEFRRPSDDKLDDQAWRDMLVTGQAPAPPAWADTFLAY